MKRPERGRCEQCGEEGHVLVIGGRWLCNGCYDTEEASLQSRKSYDTEEASPQSRKSISSRRWYWRMRYNP